MGGGGGCDKEREIQEGGDFILDFWGEEVQIAAKTAVTLEFLDLEIKIWFLDLSRPKIPEPHGSVSVAICRRSVRRRAGSPERDWRRSNEGKRCNHASKRPGVHCRKL